MRKDYKVFVPVMTAKHGAELPAALANCATPSVTYDGGTYWLGNTVFSHAFIPTDLAAAKAFAKDAEAAGFKPKIEELIPW
jgi:hypothetical protein